MKKRINKVFYSSIFAEVFLLILGLIFMIFPDLSFTIMTYILAGVLIINGIFYITTKDNLLIYNDFFTLGIVEVLLGAVILINPSIIKVLVPIVLGIVVVVKSSLDLKLSITLSKSDIDGWVLMLICSLISIILGVIIVVNPLIGSVTIQISLGILLIFKSISGIIDMIWIKKNINKIIKFLENK